MQPKRIPVNLKTARILCFNLMNSCCRSLLRLFKVGSAHFIIHPGCLYIWGTVRPKIKTTCCSSAVEMSTSLHCHGTASLSRSHDPFTRDDPQSSLWAVSWRNNFFFPCHWAEGGAATHGQEASWRWRSAEEDFKPLVREEMHLFSCTVMLVF